MKWLGSGLPSIDLIFDSVKYSTAKCVEKIRNLLLDQHPSRTFACRQTSLVLEYHFGEPFGFGCDWCDSLILP